MHQQLARGVVGGILAGLVVAIWFLVVDVIAGQPFHTPAALAGALSRQAIPSPTLRLVAVYTVLHFGVFACLGVVAVWALDALALHAGLLLGVIFGIVVQEFVFYGGLVLGGAPPSAVVAWPHVIGANVLSGMVLMAYLHRSARDDHPFGLAVLMRYPALTRGVITGLLGAVAVAAWFLVLDVIAGHPFRTPAALGSALLFGASNEIVTINLGVVATYTVVHVIAFIAAGIVFVAIAEQIERSPSLVLVAAMTAIVLEAVVVTALALVAQWVLAMLGVWSVLVGNVLAVGCMGWFVWQTHPVLRQQLRHQLLSVRV
jgi:hypothetical protein